MLLYLLIFLSMNFKSTESIARKRQGPPRIATDAEFESRQEKAQTMIQRTVDQYQRYHRDMGQSQPNPLSQESVLADKAAADKNRKFRESWRERKRMEKQISGRQQHDRQEEQKNPDDIDKKRKLENI
eukprot:54868_1